MKITLIKTNYRKIMSLLCCVLLACSIVSCKGIKITGKTEDVEGYSKAQTMIVIGSERNRFQNTFGPVIWSLPVKNEQEATYGAYFVSCMKEFLQDVKTLNLLAKEKGIIATSTDMETIRTISNRFYDSLSKEDKAFMGNPTLDDVVTIYMEYFVACKTAEYLLSNVDSEVSDADAKIIEVQQIVVSDRAKAEELYKEVTTEGANFAYYARQESEDSEISKVLAKSEKENAYYEAAFQLEHGQISDIIEEDGKFYILKCINDYDEKATLERKEKLEKSIRSNAFLKSYNEYANQHIVRFREPFWKEIDLTKNEGSKTDSFFELFDENVKF